MGISRLRVFVLVAWICIWNVDGQILMQRGTVSQRSSQQGLPQVGQKSSLSGSQANFLEQSTGQNSKLSQFSQKDDQSLNLNDLNEIDQSVDQKSQKEQDAKNPWTDGPILGQSLMPKMAQIMPCPFNPFNCFPALNSLMAWGRTFPTSTLLGAPLDPSTAASKVVLVLAEDDPTSAYKDLETASLNRVSRQSNIFDQFIATMQQTGQAYQNMMEQLSQKSSVPNGNANFLENVQQKANQFLQPSGDASNPMSLVGQAWQNPQQSLSQLLPSQFTDLAQSLQQAMAPFGQLSQSSQSSRLGQGNGPTLGSSLDQNPETSHDGADATSSKSDSSMSRSSTLGQASPNQPFNQALSQFNQWTQSLSSMAPSFPLFSQPQAQASEISEVRVKPDFATKETTDSKMATNDDTNDKFNDMKTLAIIQDALQKKNIPILWFRLPSVALHNGQNATSRNLQDLKIETKLREFESQVVAELKLLQELERIAAEMRAAAKTQSTHPTSPTYKLSYPLNKTPVHKITRGDIEKALNDEYVKKILAETMAPNAPQFILTPNTNPFKRQAASSTGAKEMTKEDIIKMMAYAYRMAKEKGEETPWMLEEKMDKNGKTSATLRSKTDEDRQGTRGENPNQQTFQKKIDDGEQRQWANAMPLPTNRQWIDHQRQQMPMDKMQLQWLEQQHIQNAQQRQWAEDSMKHIENFNAQQMASPQVGNQFQMERQWMNNEQQEDAHSPQTTEQQWVDEKNKKIAQQHLRQWINMHEPMQHRPMSFGQRSNMDTELEDKKEDESKSDNLKKENMKMNVDARQWAEQGSTNTGQKFKTIQQTEKEQRQWIETSHDRKEERQWAEGSPQSESQPQMKPEQRQWAEGSPQSQSQIQFEQRQWAEGSPQSQPQMKPEQRQWAEDSPQSQSQIQSEQRQWAEGSPQSQSQMKSEQRQWAEGSAQAQPQMKPEQRQWAEGSPQSQSQIQSEQRQWPEGSSQSQPQMKPEERQWAEGSPQSQSQIQSEQRQWAEGSPQSQSQMKSEQRQWAEGSPQSQQRQWAEGSPQSQSQMKLEQRQWAEDIPQSQLQMKPEQRQWLQENTQSAPEQRQGAEKAQLINSDMQTGQRQWIESSPKGEHQMNAEHRQWVEKAPMNVPQNGQRQWVQGNTEIETARQWAEAPPQAQQPMLQTHLQQAPIHITTDDRMMASPILGEATPQMPENAGKARHKGIFDDFDIFDLDGGKKKHKEKDSKPTIINYYYGGGYPTQYSPPPSYGSNSYGTPSYGTSYGSRPSGGSYGGASYSSYAPASNSYAHRPYGYSSNSYGSMAHRGSAGRYRTAVGDDEIQQMLNSDSAFGVTHFRN